MVEIMDETLKIIIGTLSGFIIAFFAEPIKLFFQDRNRINNLRLSLYKELCHNYSVLEIACSEVREYAVFGTHLKYLLTNQCYTYAVSKDISSFYKLKEAMWIVIANKNLDGIITEQNAFIDSNLKFKEMAELYLDSFAIAVSSEDLKSGLVRSVIGKEAFIKILERGRKKNKEKN
jgi:hypothetical protein